MAVLRTLQIPHELSPEEALSWFKKSIFDDIPPYFMTHWKTGKKFFYAHDGLIAYEEAPHHFIVAGEPLIAVGAHSKDLYHAFLEFSKRRKKDVCGYSVGERWQWDSFHKFPLGTSIRIPLQEFDMASPKAREVRRSLRVGQRRGYQVVAVKKDKRSNNLSIMKLYNEWRRSKLPMQLKFFLSKPLSENPVSHYEEWFVVKKKGEVLAFCNLLPYLVEGELGFYFDHLIFNPKDEKQALSYLISFLIDVFKSEGVSELNLGLNPFAQVDKSQWIGKLFGVLYKNPFLYRPRGLHFFKQKFAGIEDREFCFFEKEKNKWMGLADMARVTLLGYQPSEYN